MDDQLDDDNPELPNYHSSLEDQFAMFMELVQAGAWTELEHMFEEED